MTDFSVAPSIVTFPWPEADFLDEDEYDHEDEDEDEDEEMESNDTGKAESVRVIPRRKAGILPLGQFICCVMSIADTCTGSQGNLSANAEEKRLRSPTEENCPLRNTIIIIIHGDCALFIDAAYPTSIGSTRQAVPANTQHAAPHAFRNSVSDLGANLQPSYTRVATLGLLRDRAPRPDERVLTGLRARAQRASICQRHTPRDLDHREASGARLGSTALHRDPRGPGRPPGYAVANGRRRHVAR
eukprot:3934894-Rhodomonas_salina.2